MLTSLHIENYILIESLEIHPSEALSVVTGETGAGKSIMLGALGLLRGQRADTKVLLDEAQKCIIEGKFSLAKHPDMPVFFEKELDLEYEETCIIRRQIHPSGRSRAFINDTPVTLDILRKLMARLMDIHSQHDTLLLGSEAYQLNLLDDFAQNTLALEAYTDAYLAFKASEKAYKHLREEVVSLRKEHEFNIFQLEELSTLPLDELQQEELETELEKIDNTEQIRNCLQGTSQALMQAEPSAETILREALQMLGKIRGYGKDYEEWYERLNSCIIEIQDIGNEVEYGAENHLPDEEKAEKIRSQLSELYRLQQKHGLQSVEELQALRDELSEKVGRVLNFDADLEKHKKAMQAAKKQLEVKADKLSKSREKVIKPLQKQVGQTLKSLGMPNASLLVTMENGEFSSEGKDKVNFLFSANKGIKPQALKEVASGGEFSRLMLAVKYILARHVSLPTIIFDEIDTGISGEIAIKVGGIFTEMAENHQLLAISHLPQIAAKGSKHFFVYKQTKGKRTVSGIRSLEGDERILEIAQMIGGEKPSQSTLDSAKELLAL